MSQVANLNIVSGNKVNFEFTIAMDDQVVKQDNGFVLIEKPLNINKPEDLESVKHSIENYILEEFKDSGLESKFEQLGVLKVSIDFNLTSIQKVVNGIAINKLF